MDVDATSEHYDRTFYNTLNDAGVASAQAVLPIVLDMVGPQSLVDVGCGTGIWAAEASRLGVPDVRGVDGAYVPRDQRRLPAQFFVERNLTEPFELGQTFDLAVCLEVAEHLPEKHADHLVSEIVALAPAVLFSAATPLQGGIDHVNEQWPDYWIRRFEAHGYTCWDVIRPLVRYRADVAWIYRQNLMLVLGPDHVLEETIASSSRLMTPSPGDVHFEYVARYLLEREDGLRATLQKVPGLVRRRFRQALTR